jgi:hypothetical protein
MPIAMIVVLLIYLVFPVATTAQDIIASTNVSKEDSQFLIFEWKDRQSYSAHGDWLRRNHAVIDHADYCALSMSFRDVGPHSSGIGSGVIVLTSFLVLRDVDGYDSASRTFHNELTGLDIEVSFEFPAATPPGPGNKKGYPPQVVMSLSIHRGRDDAQGDIERSQVAFMRDKTWNNGPILTKLALVGDTEYRYDLGCSDPREWLRFEERLSRVRHKR